MLAKFLFFILIFSALEANGNIKSVYYIESDEIMLSDIIPQTKKEMTLFKIQPNRHTKKVSAKELVKILTDQGYKGYRAESRYINFIKKSPIDTSKILQRVEEFYHEHYHNIDIKKITIEPRGYIKSLPENYNIKIPSRSYLSNRATLSIKTLQNRKLFFDYTIDAEIGTFISRVDIKKGTELSALNTKKKSIILNKFRALPLQELTNSALQAKRNIKRDKVLTTRDVVILHLVKKNSRVTVSLNNSNIAITFSAKALQSGKNGDIINVVNNDGKRLKARVIGRNRVEIR